MVSRILNIGPIMKHLLLVDNLGSSQLGHVILNSNPNNKTFELNNIEVKKHTSQCLQSDQMQYKAIESISSTILEEGVNDTKVALLYEPL